MARLAMVGALAAPLVLASHVGAQVGGDDTKAYLTGNGLLNRGLYELAVPEYRAFLEQNPTHEKAPDARYGLGVCLYRLGAHAEALEELQQIQAAQFAFAPEVVVLRGHCHLALGEYGGAAEAFEEMIARHAEHASADDAAALLVEARYRGGDHEQAQVARRMLVERWPESPLRERAELFAGLSQVALGDDAGAIETFSGMLSRNPAGALSAQATLLLAQCEHREGSLDSALRRYRSVLDRQIASLAPDATLGVAQILHRKNDLGTAARMLEEMVRGEGASGERTEAQARLQLARVRFDQERFEEALTAFDDLRSQAPESLRDDAAYWASKTRLRMGQFSAAQRGFERAIESYPESELVPEMMYDRAVALDRDGDAEDADEVLRAFGERFERHGLAPAAVYLRATIAHREGRHDDARTHCAEFERRHGRHELAPAVAFLDAENEYLAGDYEEAERELRQFIEAFPDDERSERASYRLGMTLYRLDRFAEAESYLDSAAGGAVDDAAFAPALLALGDGLFARGDFAGAEERLAAYLLTDEPSAADDALLKLGLARARQGDDAAALDAFDRLLEEHPRSPHALQAQFERGQALVALERDDEALRVLERVADQDDTGRFTPHAINHIASIQMKRGNFEEAERLYGTIADSEFGVSSLESEALFQRAQALGATGRHTEAIEVYTELIDGYPEVRRAETARAQRAIATSRAGMIEEAIEELSRVERSGAISGELRATVLYEKAWCLRESGRAEDAAEAYEALLEAPIGDELRSYALLDLGGIRMDDGRFEQAASSLKALRSRERSASLSPEVDEQSRYRLGVCEFRLGRFKEAAELLGSFHTLHPESELIPSAGLICGESLFKLGNHRGAAEHLTRVVDGHESSEAYPSALLRLAEVQSVLQLWTQSERLFDRYLQRYGQTELWFQARFGRGYARENQGRYDEAIADYREVVSRHKGPTAARSQFQIGECLFAKREHEAAVTELMRVDILYAYPEWSAAALYEAGRCFQAMGKSQEARAQFTDVAERFGETEWAQLASQRLTEMETSARSNRPPR
jgi:TolA-binding protein